ncbi:MAG: CoA-disulfide reductase [Lachnospiraceae bacterium]|jgi:NADPH-dependent 2,4-dienoyl-CoA reductase/sulfur reductase-like enzyme/peroxiredoxin family protein/rhodanese-related sulfurtransferase/TusA-related sulfurtransferase|nr:CoA-disulfide reductase [Lachnospiraceae bacterium]
MNKKVLIVGGVAGGASAAARLRRLDETAEIIMFERDEYISFANCGLPYYIGETIQDRNRLLVQTPQAMKARFRIDVRVHSEVVQVDAVHKKVTVNSKEKGTYEESFDYLILSPGAKALRPNIPGITSDKIVTLRNIPDTDRIKEYVDRKGVGDTVVIGGGFIGVEMAENLRERGLGVTLVEAAPHILAPFDADMAVIAEKELEDNGVNLLLGDGVKGFHETGSKIEVTLSSETKITTDLVILAIGVAPDTGFLRDSGIQLGPRGHILVNDKLRTNVEGIYAVGDAIAVTDYITGQITAIPLAGPANKQGRIAADNVAGQNIKYNGSQGSSILKIFDLTAASTGANERTLQRAGISYRQIVVHPVSHASYYPGAIPMTLKLLFDEQGRVLGAQGIGYDGVDKRMDVIAAVIRMKGTVQDLTELELAYAPPYSSAKDPVNMAGYAAQNVIEGRSHIITWKELQEKGKADYLLLDVRSEIEFNNGHIKGAVNIPLDSLRERLGELEKEKEIVVYCQVGLRGYYADRILSQNGYRVQNVTGGYKSALNLKYVPQRAERKSAELMAAELAVGRQVTIDPDTQVAKQVTCDAGHYDKALDACGLCCPGPLMQVKASMEELADGQILKVSASDPGFYEDIKAWCRGTKNELLERKKASGNITAYIRKRIPEGMANPSNLTEPERHAAKETAKDNKTMVVFSGDLDKAIASFIIANGAASMGKKVTMFFTFWGLNILRKPEKVKVQKGFMDKMFGRMMPRGSRRLKLSKMNMLGFGGKMIRKVMKDKNVTSLEELIRAAMDNGIEMVACQMSMDVMGLRKEELIDGVKIGGVGYYLGEAEDSNVNLFI